MKGGQVGDPPIHYPDIMFLGLVIQSFSLGGKNLAMTEFIF